ncbi:MAG TPA: NAD(P)H-dependent oxidoreductase subunit E [Kineosporiaceae bacterium]|nr:NAD(P)H-dependent oxidoreductase subunit E [Kineosporiaceae bacterium]
MTPGHAPSLPGPQAPDRPGGGAPAAAGRVAAIVTAVLAEVGARRGPLLPVLHGVQEEFGYVPAEAVPVIAAALNLSRADVHGVLTFYRELRTSPPGRRTMRVCRAEACQARGGQAVADAVQQAGGTVPGGTSADGGLTVEDVFCFGNCALGPTVEVDGVLHGNTTPGDVPGLVTGTGTGPDPRRPAGGHGGAHLPADPDGGAAGAGVRTVHVPGDSAARSVGADRVAARLLAAGAAIGSPILLVRNGSRGALWLEPLVEVTAPDGVRWGFGPVTPDEVDGLLAAGLLSGPPADVRHPLALGPVDELGWLAGQNRVTFARVGIVDPASAQDYEDHGGLAGLRAALARDPADVVAEVTASGLRGRGGAGFPAGIKWRTVAQAAPGPDGVKFVVCNADEGDSGTFADRMLLEGDPFSTIEGMLIAGYAVGAREGYLYLRSEYPDAVAAVRRAVAAAYARGWLGPDVLGSGFAFDLQVRVGAGAYICGEETSMLESLEGRRAVVRAKPPLPALEGLFGAPTVVNNLLTLATVPAVLAGGAQAYADLGVGRSRGTQVFQLAGNLARGGIVETAFGITLGELVYAWGGGTASGRPVRAVQVGGPLGAYLPPDRFGLPLDYEAFAAEGAMVGHGGVVVFDDTVDLSRQARFAMEFCAEESCGKCTPCRVGAVRGVEVIDRIRAGVDREANLAVLEDLCELMTDGSLCAMGGLTPLPVRSALRYWPQDFGMGDGAVASAGEEQQ